MDKVSADTEDLGRFVALGERYTAALRSLRDAASDRRVRVSGELGWSPPPPSADRAIEGLIDRAVIGNAFVDVINDALRSFDPDIGSPESTVAAAVIDAGLAEVGLGLATAPTSPLAIGRLADGLAGRSLDGSGDVETDIEIAGRAYQRVVGAIDNDDDLGMSNGELNRVNDILADLDVEAVDLVVASLSPDQLRILFHNVHSSGFWSNDWDDRERSEFYALLAPMSTETKAHAGQHSPYLATLAEAELATAGDPAAERALVSLHTAEGFTDDLDFDERVALLAQVGHAPDQVAIANLERLAGQDWLHDLDLADTQRSAKMIAYLSVHQAGDQTVIANTLDLFLGPNAPYRLDWDQDGGAYGSARGEQFHLNRAYLDDGNEPVERSVPSGTSLRRTEHMVTHTVAHEVNHLVNEDRVATSYEYFMGEYRAFYVGQLARNATPPTRADVEDRVELLLTATGGAYSRIADAVDDPEQGPLIAAFVEDVLGRPVTAETLAVEIGSGVTDPTVAAPLPVSVDGGPNVLDNFLPPPPR